MELFPAIDIRGGMAVRLTQGDFNRMRTFSGDPVSVAEGFAAAGAKNLHVVDLDGAKDGSPVNFELIRRISAVKGLFVEVGGGIRGEEQIEKYLNTGVGRVILGTAAAENFEFGAKMIKKYGSGIAVGVDAKNGVTSVRGWTQEAGLDSLEFCGRLSDAGVSAIIYTDISRDGAMSGTNMEVYRSLLKLIKCDIIASGGITGIKELSELKVMGVHGAILGTSIYTGAINLKEALTVCG